MIFVCLKLILGEGETTNRKPSRRGGEPNHRLTLLLVYQIVSTPSYTVSSSILGLRNVDVKTSSPFVCFMAMLDPENI
jgi:hypothetical protein